MAFLGLSTLAEFKSLVDDAFDLLAYLKKERGQEWTAMWKHPIASWMFTVTKSFVSLTSIEGATESLKGFFDNDRALRSYLRPSNGGD